MTTGSGIDTPGILMAGNSVFRGWLLPLRPSPLFRSQVASVSCEPLPAAPTPCPTPVGSPPPVLGNSLLPTSPPKDAACQSILSVCHAPGLLPNIPHAPHPRYFPSSSQALVAIAPSGGLVLSLRHNNSSTNTC